jgi:hypothetical protein
LVAKKEIVKNSKRTHQEEKTIQEGNTEMHEGRVPIKI